MSDNRYDTPLSEIVEDLPGEDGMVYTVVMEHYDTVDELDHNDVLNLYDIMGYAQEEDNDQLLDRAEARVDQYFDDLEADFDGLDDNIPLQLDSDVTPEQVRARYNDRSQWLAEGSDHHLKDTSSQTLFLYSVKESIVGG